MFTHSKIHAALFSAALCLCNSAAADSLQFQSAREMQHELVILVDFPDSRMQFSAETFSNALNAEKYDGECSTGSVADYFDNSSHGAYRPVFDVFGIYTLPENSTYYGENDISGNDRRADEMIVEACRLAAADGIDLSKYDHDFDGTIDCVHVIYAGEGESADGSPDAVRPAHATTSAAIADGISIGEYTCCNASCEAFKREIGSSFAGIGQFVQNFAHAIGLPYLYSTSRYNTRHTPGIYDLMDSGFRLNFNRTPASLSAYERMLMGWLRPQQINPPKEGCTASLPSIDEGTALLFTSGSVAHNMDVSDPYPKIFYLLENKSGQGWDKFLNDSAAPFYDRDGDEGLLITKIIYDEQKWETNMVNYSSPHGVAYICEEDDSGYFPILPGTKRQTKIEFDSFSIRNIHRDSDTGTVSFVISDSNGHSGVNAMPLDAPTIVGGTGAIKVDGHFDSIAIFSLSGAMIYRGTDAEIKVPHGFYVVRVDETTAKIIVR